jgi:hypothetical protein
MRSTISGRTPSVANDHLGPGSYHPHQQLEEYSAPGAFALGFHQSVPQTDMRFNAAPSFIPPAAKQVYPSQHQTHEASQSQANLQSFQHSLDSRQGLMHDLDGQPHSYSRGGGVSQHQTPFLIATGGSETTKSTGASSRDISICLCSKGAGHEAISPVQDFAKTHRLANRQNAVLYTWFVLKCWFAAQSHDELSVAL